MHGVTCLPLRIKDGKLKTQCSVNSKHVTPTRGQHNIVYDFLMASSSTPTTRLSRARNPSIVLEEPLHPLYSTPPDASKPLDALTREIMTRPYNGAWVSAFPYSDEDIPLVAQTLREDCKSAKIHISRTEMENGIPSFEDTLKLCELRWEQKKGWGLFARERIRKNTLIAPYFGEFLNQKQFEKHYRVEEKEIKRIPEQWVLPMPDPENPGETMYCVNDASDPKWRDYNGLALEILSSKPNADGTLRVRVLPYANAQWTLKVGEDTYIDAWVHSPADDSVRIKSLAACVNTAMHETQSNNCEFVLDASQSKWPMLVTTCMIEKGQELFARYETQQGSWPKKISQKKLYKRLQTRRSIAPH